MIGYVAAGYGAHGSTIYVSPFSDPLGFVGALATRLPLLVSEALTAVPAALWWVGDAAR